MHLSFSSHHFHSDGDNTQDIVCPDCSVRIYNPRLKQEKKKIPESFLVRTVSTDPLQWVEIVFLTSPLANILWVSHLQILWQQDSVELPAHFITHQHCGYWSCPFLGSKITVFWGVSAFITVFHKDYSFNKLVKHILHHPRKYIPLNHPRKYNSENRTLCNISPIFIIATVV